MDWFPPLGVTSNLGADAVVAVLMVGVEVYLLLQLLPRAGGPPTLTRMTIGTAALLGSAAFLLSLLNLLFFPGSYDAATELLWALNFMMFVPPGLWVIAVIVFRDRRIRANGLRWPVLIATAATAAEILMGLLFSVSSPVPAIDLSTISASLVSPWFMWSMGAAMAALLVWVRLEPRTRAFLGLLVAAAAVAPWVVAAPALGAVLMASVMTVAFILLFERLSARNELAPGELRFLLAIAGSFGLMAATQLVAVYDPTPAGELPFGVGMVLVMTVDLAYLAHRALAGSRPEETPVPWATRRLWTVGLLGTSFLADWMMAAAWAVAVSGRGIILFGLAAGSSVVSGLAQNVAAVAETVAVITASPYFLGLMGLEMGALVVLRIRTTHDVSVRRRLGLALGMYGIYSVVGPSWITGWASIPGTWANVGAFGPVSSALVVPMLASYGIIAGAVLLFGRRTYCSVLCPSAVMYGGTLAQKLVPSLRESPTARRNVLGSSFKVAPQAISFGAWATLGLATGFSAAHSIGATGFTLPGVDAAVLYSGMVWNVTWYGFFIAIPYLGMSGCRTWGFCTTGTLYGAISILGFYRKEVFDREICRQCRTRDCAKACEVGLVDMPTAFIRDGYFRSAKCVGAHDCEAACPYGNLVSRDVRDALRKALGLPDRYASRRLVRPVSSLLSIQSAPPSGGANPSAPGDA